MLHTVKSRYFEDEERAPNDAPAVLPTLAATAAVVALGFLGSRILGVVRTVAIAHQFGTGSDLDAYFVAFRLPDLIFQLLAGATLGSAFIPTFARIMAERGEREAWRLASSVLNLVFVATLVAAVIGLLFAPLLVPLTAPGLGDSTGQNEEMTSLAIDLTRIMMISPLLFAVSGMFMGILNARHNFLASALAPMFYNAAIIVGALISDDVKVLAFAVVIGALLHMLVQIPALGIAGMRWQPLWDWRDAAVREVGRLMGPRVIGLAAYHLNFVIATFFASTVGAGAISAVNYAWLIVMTPLGLFGMAISTAIFPRLAEQAVRDEEELRRTLSRALRLILYLTIPASVGLMVTASPLTALLLRSGAFDASSSDLVVGALVLYALGLFAHAGIEILSRGFYALADTRTPVTFAVVSMAVNLVLCLVLVSAFEVNGLALALSIAAIVEFALLARALAVRLRGLENARLAWSLMRTVASAVLMGELVGLWLIGLSAAGLLDGDDKILSAVAVVGATVIGVPAFYVTSRLLGSTEARLLAERLPMPARLRRLAGVAGSP
jgi:putative peptidoglycan lipid II flippase